VNQSAKVAGLPAVDWGFAAAGLDCSSQHWITSIVIAIALMARHSSGGFARWAFATDQFTANAVRLQLHALAYIGNFLRTHATLEPIKNWPLTSLKEKLIKIGGKVVSHGRYVTFQLAEVAVPQQMFADILSLIARLRAPPAPA
jgi:hypothetical protein